MSCSPGKCLPGVAPGQSGAVMVGRLPPAPLVGATINCRGSSSALHTLRDTTHNPAPTLRPPAAPPAARAGTAQWNTWRAASRRWTQTCLPLCTLPARRMRRLLGPTCTASGERGRVALFLSRSLASCFCS